MNFSGFPVPAEIRFGRNGLYEEVVWLPDASNRAPIGPLDFDGNGRLDWLGAPLLVPGELQAPERFQVAEPVVADRVMFDMDLGGDLDAFTEIVPSFLGASGGVRANTGAGSLIQSPLLNGVISAPNLSRPAYALGDLDANGRPESLFCELVPGQGPFDSPVELGWRRFELLPGGRSLNSPC